MKTFKLGKKNAVSFDFDKNFILSGIHRLKKYNEDSTQRSYMIFGLIITIGYFI